MVLSIANDVGYEKGYPVRGSPRTYPVDLALAPETRVSLGYRTSPVQKAPLPRNLGLKELLPG
ncbi:MAG: hypothetical protein NUW12_07740 [Firmicutes bacterium]|nr:hypothetical protein [Bacillota bacterium]MDH7495459.1 hypothetical protein [Bacillota bacterium]